MKTTLTKLFWALFAVAGAVFVYFVQPGKHEWVHAASVMAVGLAMLSFVSERRNDERCDHLKLKALKASLPVALVFTLLINMVVLNPQEPDVNVRSLSAFDFTVFVMLSSLALFYFWRWQDGKPAPPTNRSRASRRSVINTSKADGGTAKGARQCLFDIAPPCRGGLNITNKRPERARAQGSWDRDALDVSHIRNGSTLSRRLVFQQPHGG